MLMSNQKHLKFGPEVQHLLKEYLNYFAAVAAVRQTESSQALAPGMCMATMMFSSLGIECRNEDSWDTWRTLFERILLLSSLAYDNYEDRPNLSRTSGIRACAEMYGHCISISAECSRDESKPLIFPCMDIHHKSHYFYVKTRVPEVWSIAIWFSYDSYESIRGPSLSLPPFSHCCFLNCTGAPSLEDVPEKKMALTTYRNRPHILELISNEQHLNSTFVFSAAFSWDFLIFPEPSIPGIRVLDPPIPSRAFETLKHPQILGPKSWISQEWMRTHWTHDFFNTFFPTIRLANWAQQKKLHFEPSSQLTSMRPELLQHVVANEGGVGQLLPSRWNISKSSLPRFCMYIICSFMD